MKSYRYSRASLSWEIAIAAAILGLILAFFISGKPPIGTTVFLVVVGSLLAYYLWLNFNKWRTRVDMDDIAISISSPARNATLNWGEDWRIRVRYYGPRKKSASGVHTTWLKGPSGSLKFDSALNDYFLLMADIGGKIQKHGVELDEITRWNLEKMSAIPPRPKAPPAEEREPASDSPSPER
jgi:hypothetical protein